jgi:ABC-type multidrug transport system ATPase subunit
MLEVYILNMVSIKFEQAELLPKRYYSGEIHISEGNLTKICGDNGVGKTTLFKYCQFNQKKYFKEKVIFLDQKPLVTLYDYSLSEVKKLLSQYWKEYLVPDAEKLWDKMISDFRLNSQHKVSYLSGGQNQLLKLLLISIQQTQIFFLDEPFTALDNTMGTWWKNWIEQKLAENKTIVVIDHSSKLNTLSQVTYSLELESMDVIGIKKLS